MTRKRKKCMDEVVQADFRTDAEREECGSVLPRAEVARLPFTVRQMRGLRHLHFHESRRSVFPQPFLPPVEMRRAQLPFSAERRHTLPAPHLFGNQPAPLRPCFPASLLLRHRATLLCDDHSPQDAVHVALTPSLSYGIAMRWRSC